MITKLSVVSVTSTKILPLVCFEILQGFVHLTYENIHLASLVKLSDSLHNFVSVEVYNIVKTKLI